MATLDKLEAVHETETDAGNTCRNKHVSSAAGDWQLKQSIVILIKRVIYWEVYVKVLSK